MHKYRLTQSSRTGEYRFEVQFKDTPIWTIYLGACPQNLAEALLKLDDLNKPEIWNVIA